MKILRLIAAAPLLAGLYLYRWLVSPLLHGLLGPLGGGCRFEPTCSRYAIDALKTHPLHRALFLICRRIGRCHPWGGSGYDPVPPARPMPPHLHIHDSAPEGGQERTDDKSHHTRSQRDEGKPEEKDEHDPKECQPRKTD